MPELDVKDFIRREAKAAGLPESLALAVAEQESNFKPDAIGPEFELRPGVKTRAQGLFQVIPETAARYKSADDGPDPVVQNVRTGVRYLKELFDRHGGNLDKIAAEYGGVKHDTTYVPSLTEKVMRWQEQAGGTTGATDPATSTTLGTAPPLVPAHGPAAPPTWDERLNRGLRNWVTHRGDKPVGFLHKFGLDPTEAEDRPNIGGTIGGVAGAIIGSRGGPEGMRAGGVIGRYAGSSIGGAAGQLYNEFLGPPPAPDAYDTPTKRVAAAAGGQAAMEAVGDTVIGPLKSSVRAIQQQGVSQAAQQAFARGRQAVATGFDAEIAALRTRIRAERTGLMDQAAQVREGAQQTLDAVRARTRATLRGVTRSGIADVRTARAAGEAGVERATGIGQGARQVAESQYLAGQPARVPPLVAGRAVLGVVEGDAAPVTLARKRLGANVEKAAEDSGLIINFRNARAEAVRIFEKELAPLVEHTTTSPQVFAPGSPLPKTLTAVQQAQAAELAKHPAAGLIAQIASAPDDIPMGDLHKLYSSLASANSGVFDAGLKSKVEGLTKHLLGEMRAALGSVKHKPYERAAKEFATLIKLFERADLDGIQKLATSKEGPEAIIKMIDPGNPTQTAAIMEMLTSTSGRAAKTGSTASREMGARAAKAVRQAWFAENVLNGGLEGLSERLAKLDETPEFRNALLGGEHVDVLANTRKLATLWDNLVAEDAARVGKATAASKTGVETAAERARQARYQTQTAGDLTNDAAKTQKRATTSAEAKRIRDIRAGQDQALQDAQARAKAAMAPGAEEQAFLDSSLAPDRLAASRKRFFSPLRVALGAAGVTLAGPKGVALALLLQGGGGRAAERDLLKYVAYSDSKLTRALVRHVSASQKLNLVGSQVVRQGVREYQDRHPKSSVADVLNDPDIRRAIRP